MASNTKISIFDFFKKIKYSKQFRFYVAALVLLVGLIFAVIYLLTFIIKNLNIGLSQNQAKPAVETFAVDRFEKLNIIKK